MQTALLEGVLENNLTTTLPNKRNVGRVGGARDVVVNILRLVKVALQEFVDEVGYSVVETLGLARQRKVLR